MARANSNESPSAETLLERLCGILEYPLVVFTYQNETILVLPGVVGFMRCIQVGNRLYYLYTNNTYKEQWGLYYQALLCCMGPCLHSL